MTLWDSTTIKIKSKETPLYGNIVTVIKTELNSMFLRRKGEIEMR